MIVGATPTPDRAILAQASTLYGAHRLRRVYYSAFSPIPSASSKLPLIAPPLVREHRLYQADWLMRFYGFDVGEITSEAQPDLPLGIDPKLAWALRNVASFPIDLNRAPRELLLRVPGLGVRNVDRILGMRRWHRLTLADLTKLRVPLAKTLPFIVTADHVPKIVGQLPAASRSNSTSSPRPRAVNLRGLLRLTAILHRVEQFTFAPTFTAWQQAARRALQAGVEPGAIHWQELDDTQPALGMFDGQGDEPALATPATDHRVPRAFVDVARRVACHRDPQRWALLYRILYRLTHGEAHLLAIAVDPDIHLLTQMDRAIRRDVHKMHAFVRFRTVTAEEGEPWYVAWFEPAHLIVEMNASFFTDRFASMRWSILTPDRCAHWDGCALHFTAGLTRAEAPNEDAVEPLWRQYYANIFNPARVKTHAMQKEMPKRYWKNLPEAELIPDLLRQAPGTRPEHACPQPGTTSAR